MTGKSSGYEIRRFTPGYEALGIVLDFLTRRGPFQEFRSAKLVRAVKQQIARGHHVCAFREERLVGYAGWLYITKEAGERWLSGKGELTATPDDLADAAALTIVQVDDSDLVFPLIRAVRRIGKGKRIFFRRDYEGSRKRQKRQTVMNV